MAEYISLTGKHIFGRDRGCDVQLDGLEISRHHTRIESLRGVFTVHDLESRAGTLVNGRQISERPLIYGDILSIGRHHFRFDGQGLKSIASASGASVEARNIERIAGEKVILRDINLSIEPGEFVGILGTSGAGKSTLLDILSGIRPASTGDVTISGVPVATYLERGSAVLGYVPQSDIVHYDLTVRQAVIFAASLRLPEKTPHQVIEDCILCALRRLQIDHLADVPIHRISGGQRKRVSVAVEILSRPPLLFLDEPSSGLDPKTEFELMDQLRDLANLGCTVVCTTHVMDNVHVFDKLIILRAGRLIFTGNPQDAKAHFKVDRFVQLYERIESQPLSHWLAAFPLPPPLALHSPIDESQFSRKPANVFWTLLLRQTQILLNDFKNPLFLVGQPLLIGLLVAWMGENSGFKLFVGHLATFWFGCSNTSQEIVKELPIYRREHLVGVQRGTYLFSKFVYFFVITLAQAAVLYAAIHVGPHPPAGDVSWQWISLLFTTTAAVAIGLLNSTWARTPAQATMLVPLILLPQIVLSGFVLPPVTSGGMKGAISEIMPSHASQCLMDVSLVWNTQLDADEAAIKDRFPAHRNIMAKLDLVPGDWCDDDTLPRIQVRQLTIWTVLALILAWMGIKRRESAP